MIGDKELMEKLQSQLPRVAKKITRKALRQGAKRAASRIVANIKKHDLVNTRNMLNAFERVKIRSSSRNPRKLIRIGPELPSREELDIDPDDEFYYPMAVEKNIPFMKPAIDDHKNAEFREIGREIGAGIERESKK